MVMSVGFGARRPSTDGSGATASSTASSGDSSTAGAGAGAGACAGSAGAPSSGGSVTAGSGALTARMSSVGASPEGRYTRYATSPDALPAGASPSPSNRASTTVMLSVPPRSLASSMSWLQARARFG